MRHSWFDYISSVGSFLKETIIAGFKPGAYALFTMRTDRGA